MLDQMKIPYQTLEYTYDIENLEVAIIAKENGLEVETIYKTLVLVGDKTGILVAVIAGNHHLSLKKVAPISSNKKVEMAPVKDLQHLTGYVRGGCSPIGMKKQFPVFIDETAKTMEQIYVNAGIRGMLFACKPDDLLNACNGIYANIIEDAQ